jgi:hypothetical protein
LEVQPPTACTWPAESGTNVGWVLPLWIMATPRTSSPRDVDGDAAGAAMLASHVSG